MSKSDSKNEAKENERRFSREQYDMLKRCSQKRDMTEWNEWRKENETEEIWLQEANFRGAHLKNAHLQDAHLENADLENAHLENALLQDAHLENAYLQYAHLENTHPWSAHLENAHLQRTHLENAYFWHAHLENANLGGAYLENADLEGAHLENANLSYAHLQRANFRYAIINGATEMFECRVDRDTDFRETALDSIRMELGTKYLLRYNIRRMNWEDWYKGLSRNMLVVLAHQFVTLPVRLFWFISNYGISTCRIVVTFFALAFTFALIYWRWSDLFIFNNEIDVNHFQSLWHACYFSVVTMTTLGFGDIAANPASWGGQALLMVQVILGYFLLGALVTRLAVLFTSDGPAGSFTSMDKETKELLAKLKEDMVV